MKIEISGFSLNCFNLGLYTAEGEDEFGNFNMLSLGFLLFSIDIYVY